jgi:hypothetical protein
MCSPGQKFAEKPRNGFRDVLFHEWSEPRRIRFAAVRSWSGIEIRGDGTDRSALIPIGSTQGTMGEAV